MDPGVAVTALGYGLVGLAAGLVATRLSAPLARRLRIVDEPGPLKVHQDPVPCLGGLGVAAGILAGLGLSGQWRLLLPLAPALAVGVLDDRFSLPPVMRLVAGTLVGVLVAVVEPTRLGAGGGVLAVVVTLLLVNALNLVDGLDGLAGGLGLASAAGFWAILGSGGREAAAALAGSLAGFLWFNRPPARVFLGDGGAYLVGAFLAELLVRSWSPAYGWATSVSALLLVAYPVAEVLFSILRRQRSKAPLSRGDRGHSYDRLVSAGWSAPKAVLACTSLQVVLCAVAVALSNGPASLAVGVVVLAATGLVLAGARAGLLGGSGAHES